MKTVKITFMFTDPRHDDISIVVTLREKTPLSVKSR